MYVSDLLETLLDCSEIRSVVRSQVVDSIRVMLGNCEQELVPVVEYYAAKCMGFPAVWFYSRSLGLNPPQIADLLASRKGALLFSLTTSIADDLIDEDESAGSRELMVFYSLIMRCLTSEDWSCREWLRAMERHVLPLFRQFVYARENFNAECLVRRENEAAMRIGGFHSLIIDHLLFESDVLVPRRRELSKLGGRFGAWCARLDDTLDMRSDLRSGRWSTFPMRVLFESNKSSVLPPNGSPPEAFRDLWLTDVVLTRLHDDCVAQLSRELLAIARDAARMRLSSQLVDELRQSSNLLPTALLQVLE